MKTLLAIINKPEESKGFIVYVSNLAKYIRANVHLLYVHTPNVYPVGTAAHASVQMNQNTELLIKQATKEIEKEIKSVSHLLPSDVSLQFSAEVGVASQLVASIVDSNKADMLVVETMKNENFWSQTPSSIDIINSIDCPVFVIPNKSSFTPFSQIVYATDYKEEDVLNIKKLVSLMHSFNPKITALHITNDTNFEIRLKTKGFQDTIREKIGYNYVDVKSLESDKNLEMPQVVTNYVMQNGVNLIAVMKENRGFLEHLFTKGSAEKIIDNSLTPVLVYHEKNNSK